VGRLDRSSHNPGLVRSGESRPPCDAFRARDVIVSSAILVPYDKDDGVFPRLDCCVRPPFSAITWMRRETRDIPQGPVLRSQVRSGPYATVSRGKTPSSLSYGTRMAELTITSRRRKRHRAPALTRLTNPGLCEDLSSLPRASCPATGPTAPTACSRQGAIQRWCPFYRSPALILISLASASRSSQYRHSRSRITCRIRSRPHSILALIEARFLNPESEDEVIGCI